MNHLNRSFFMIPLFCNPISTIELNKPQMEFVTSITSIQHNGTLMAFDVKDFFYNDKNLQLIGTTIISDTLKRYYWKRETEIDLFLDDFDVVVKLPVVKSFTKKVKIKSISKYRPKISI